MSEGEFVKSEDRYTRSEMAEIFRGEREPEIDRLVNTIKWNYAVISAIHSVHKQQVERIKSEAAVIQVGD